jgi:hypothetical protein
LQDAFAASLKDSDFLAEAGKRKLEVQYASGADIREIVERAFKAPKDVVARVRSIYDGK